MGPVIRRRLTLWAAIAPAATPSAAGGARAAVGRLGPSSLSASGASDLSNLGSGGWRVASSANATQTGALISTPEFNTSSWLPVANDDAGAPGTELAALQQNGRCPNIFFSNNMQNCYGQLTKVGPDRIKQFSVPWWWRTDFTANLQAGQDAKLIVNGVVGSADVWLNGHQVATSSTVTGAYTRFTFDVTGQVRQGTNSLAIEVNANDPTTMFTLDNVDWTQIPPDNNTGIQFPVQLQVGGPLTDGNAHVLQTNAADLSSSALTVSSDITNTTSSAQAGLVAATITPPGTGTPITVSQQVTVPASTTQTVSFTPAQFPALTIASPRVWWPYQLGAQPLYTLTTSVSQNSVVLNSTSETFGIRTITSYLTGASAGA